MERGVVGTKDTAIKLGGILVFFLYSTKMRITDDLYGKVVLTLVEQARYIKLATHEGTLDTTQVLTIQIDIGLPVDAIEVEPLLIATQVIAYLELITIPEVGTEEGF